VELEIVLVSLTSGSVQGSTQPSIQRGYLGLFLRGGGVKLQGHEDAHSPPSSAEVKNDGAIAASKEMKTKDTWRLVICRKGKGQSF
jgi:hypothetical protein